MPSNWNALFIAWAVSLIIVIGGGLMFELTYTPPSPQQVAKDAASAEPQHADTTTPPDEDEGYTANTGPSGLEDSNEAPDTTANDVPAASQAVDEPQPSNSGPAQQDPETGMSTPAQTAPASAPQIAISGTLRVEADPALLEQSNQGPLPKIAEDGRKPFNVYAAPAPRNDTKHRIAIVVTDMGMRARNTRHAIAELPQEVTFAFSPYASNLIEWGEEARRTGHEVLVMVPMEPENYPQNDPGPFTLLASSSTRENVNLLKSSLGRLTGYVGIINHMGSRFTAAADSLRPVLDELQRRGLMMVDSRASQYSRAVNMSRAIGLPSAYNNRYVDDNLAPDAISAELAELEQYAQTVGSAVGVAHNYPVTINAINRWAAGLEARGFILVPITAVADRQPPPR